MLFAKLEKEISWKFLLLKLQFTTKCEKSCVSSAVNKTIPFILFFYSSVSIFKILLLVEYDKRNCNTLMDSITLTKITILKEIYSYTASSQECIVSMTDMTLCYVTPLT